MTDTPITDLILNHGDAAFYAHPEFLELESHLENLDIFYEKFTSIVSSCLKPAENARVLDALRSTHAFKEAFVSKFVVAYRCLRTRYKQYDGLLRSKGYCWTMLLPFGWRFVEHFGSTIYVYQYVRLVDEHGLMPFVVEQPFRFIKTADDLLHVIHVSLVSQHPESISLQDVLTDENYWTFKIGAFANRYKPTVYNINAEVVREVREGGVGRNPILAPIVSAFAKGVVNGMIEFPYKCPKSSFDIVNAEFSGSLLYKGECDADHAVTKFIDVYYKAVTYKTALKSDTWLFIGPKLREVVEFAHVNPSVSIICVFGELGGEDLQRAEENKRYARRILELNYDQDLKVLSGIYDFKKKEAERGERGVSARVRNVAQAYLDYVGSGNAKQSIFYNQRTYHRCKRTADMAVAFSSLYDISPESLAFYMRHFQVKTCKATRIACNDLFTQGYSWNDLLGVRFSRQGNKALMTFPGGCAKGYVHSYKNLKAWCEYSKFNTPSGMLWYEVVSCRLGFELLELSLYETLDFDKVRANPIVYSSYVRLIKARPYMRYGRLEYFYVDRYKFSRIKDYCNRLSFEAFEPHRINTMASSLRNMIVVGDCEVQNHWDLDEVTFHETITYCILYSSLVRSEMVETVMSAVKIGKEGGFKSSWLGYFYNELEDIWSWRSDRLAFLKITPTRMKLELDRLLVAPSALIWEPASPAAIDRVRRLFHKVRHDSCGKLSIERDLQYLYDDLARDTTLKAYAKSFAWGCVKYSTVHLWGPAYVASKCFTKYVRDVSKDLDNFKDFVYDNAGRFYELLAYWWHRLMCLLALEDDSYIDPDDEASYAPTVSDQSSLDDDFRPGFGDDSDNDDDDGDDNDDDGTGVSPRVTADTPDDDDDSRNSDDDAEHPSDNDPAYNLIYDSDKECWSCSLCDATFLLNVRREHWENAHEKFVYVSDDVTDTLDIDTSASDVKPKSLTYKPISSMNGDVPLLSVEDALEAVKDRGCHFDPVDPTPAEYVERIRRALPDGVQLFIPVKDQPGIYELTKTTRNKYHDFSLEEMQEGVSAIIDQYFTNGTNAKEQPEMKALHFEVYSKHKDFVVPKEVLDTRVEMRCEVSGSGKTTSILQGDSPEVARALRARGMEPDSGFDNTQDLYIAPTRELLADFRRKIRKVKGVRKDISAKTFDVALLMKDFSKYRRIYMDEAWTYPINYVQLIMSKAPKADFKLYGDREQNPYLDEYGSLQSNATLDNHTHRFAKIRYNRYTFRFGEELCAFLRNRLGYAIWKHPLNFKHSKITWTAPDDRPKAALDIHFSTKAGLTLKDMVISSVSAKCAQGKSEESVNVHFMITDGRIVEARSLVIVACSRAESNLNFVLHDDKVFKKCLGDISSIQVLDETQFGPKAPESEVVTMKTAPIEVPQFERPEKHGDSRFAKDVLYDILTTTDCIVAKDEDMVLAEPKLNKFTGELDYIEKDLPSVYPSQTRNLDNSQVAFKVLPQPSDRFHGKVKMLAVNEKRDRVIRALVRTRYGKTFSVASGDQSLTTFIHRQCTKKQPAPLEMSYVYDLNARFRRVFCKENFTLHEPNTILFEKLYALYQRNINKNVLHNIDKNLDAFHLLIKEHLKDITKIKGLAAAGKNKVGQPIKAWAKELSTTFSTYFTTVEETIVASLKDEVIYANGISEENFNDRLNALPSYNNVGGADIGEFDGSQNSGGTQKLEKNFFDSEWRTFFYGENPSAMPSNLFQMLRKLMKSISEVLTYLNIEVKASGAPDTLLGNTILAMLLCVNCLEEKNFRGGAFKGDDSWIFSLGKAWRDPLFFRNKRIARMDMKISSPVIPEFCNLLYVSGHLFYNYTILAAKILSVDLSDEDKFEAYKEAVADKLRPYFRRSEPVIGAMAHFLGCDAHTAQLFMQQIVNFSRSKYSDISSQLDDIIVQ